MLRQLPVKKEDSLKDKDGVWGRLLGGGQVLPTDLWSKI